MADIQRTIADDVHPPGAFNMQRPVERVAYSPAALRRVSWGAALAGGAIALVTQLVLHLLGGALGMHTLQPLTDGTPPAATLSTTAGIWLMVSWGMALLVGGWAAGRLAGLPRRLDAMLHGVLTWACTALVLFSLLTTVVGNLLQSRFGSVHTLFTASGPGVGAALPGVDIPWENLRQEIATTLRQVEHAAPPLDPMGETGRQTARASEPASQELLSTIERFIRQGPGAVSLADREAVLEALTASTTMSQEQATQALQRWQRDYQRTRAAFEQQARQAAERAAHSAAQVAWWLVLVLGLGAIAAALGGALGAPRDVPTTVLRDV